MNEPPATQAPRVLIVDDDEVDRMAVHRALRKLDANVIVAETDRCDSAIKLLRKDSFDCVFLDYFLPDGSGLDVLHRAREAGIRTPFVILTGQGDEELAVELMKAGATDYLPKNGATTDRISQCLRNALRLHDAERTAARAESERSRLLVLEREARSEAEAAQRRLAFLAEASAHVSSSLDYQTTLENVAKLAVPVLADWCFVDLALPDGGFERVALAHKDPHEKLAKGLRRKFHGAVDAPHGITRVIRTGTPEITTETPDWILVSVARDAEHLEFLRQLGIRSTMCIPLITRGKTLGAMTFIATDASRQYSMVDLSFAEEISRRAALAVDNARLYQDAVDAEGRLRHQFEFTSAITESLAEGVCAVDADGAFTFVNPAAEVMLQWRKDELLGRRLQATIHLERADGTRFEAEHSPLLDAIRSGELYRTEDDAFTRRDGTTFAVSYAASPLLADGKPAGAVLVFHDISARRASDAKLRFQASLLEAVGQAVIATDVDGRVTYWNRAAERTYGWTAAEAKGRRALDLIAPPNRREGLEALMSRLQKGQTFSGEGTLRRKDGTEFHAMISNTPLYDANEQLIGIIGVSEDVTERKRAQAELEESRRQMALSEKLSALGTLISGVAHEIRTPLTYLANNIFLAQTRLEPLKRRDEEAAEVITDVGRFMGSASEAIDRINSLVKDLRAHVMPEGGRRLEAGLHEVVGGAVELFRATQRGSVEIEADLEPTPPMLLDKGQVQRVVINLLVNAADAMQPKGGRIRVATRALPDGAELEVTDEGCGLTPEAEVRLFDPFFTTKPEGTGLGLSITRRIIDTHGGRIRYRTKRDEGTSFYVFIPHTASTQDDLSAPAEPSAGRPRARSTAASR